MRPDHFISRIVVGFPKAVVAIFLGVAISAAAMLPGLERDPTPYLLPPDHESRVNLATLREEFTGANDGIIVLLKARTTVFNPETLARLNDLTRAFETMNLITPKDRHTLEAQAASVSPELAAKIKSISFSPVDTETWMRIDEIREMLSPENKEAIEPVLDLWIEKLSPVIEVTSLANTDNILAKDNMLKVGQIYDNPPKSEEQIKRIRQEVMSNALFNPVLVSDEGKNTGIVIELALGDDATKERFLLYEQVRDILENQVPGKETHYISGIPVVTGALGTVMEKDTGRLFPIVIVLVMTCLYLTFRQVKGVLVPLAVVILSLVVTLGVKAATGIPLNIITTTLPVFILSIGVADGIHMFSEYRDNLMKGGGRTEAVTLTLKCLTMPVVMTSLTTAVAFYAISVTEIVQLNHFGLFVSLGTIVAMLFSLFFIPALLLLLPEKSSDKVREKKPGDLKKLPGSEARYEAALVRITLFFLKTPVILLAISLAVFSVALFGASKVVVDNNNAAYFLKDSSIYQATQTLNRDGAGSNLINFLISAAPDLSGSAETAPFKDPANLKPVSDLVDFLNTQPHVGKVLGLTELIKRINYVLNDEDPDHNIVPTGGSGSAHLISQLLLLYENGGGDTLSDYTDTGYTKLNIPVVLKTNSSRHTQALTRAVTAWAELNLPDRLSLEVSGSANVSVAATDEIVAGQVKGLLISLAVVSAMLLITFRRLIYAVIAMVPLVMTITINFGIMGFFSIPLDIGTAIISSIVIGIGVDYSIHYIARLKMNLAMGMKFHSALENTIRHSGKAIVSNALTVGLGFVALLFSILTPLIVMGWMITITMAVSAFSTLVLVPILMGFVEKKADASVKEPKQLIYTAQKG